MTFEKYVENAREVFRDNFNAFLESLDLQPITAFVDTLSEVRLMERSLAVYPTANVTTYKETETSAETSVTVTFYLNEDASRESSNLAIQYFSAIIAFIHLYRFGEYDVISDAYLSLMDTGEMANGAFVLITSRIATNTDGDIYGDYIYG
jgi:hypothetical protein